MTGGPRDPKTFGVSIMLLIFHSCFSIFMFEIDLLCFFVDAHPTIKALSFWSRNDMNHNHNKCTRTSPAAASARNGPL